MPIVPPPREMSPCCSPIRVLAVTNLYPTPKAKSLGVFVEQQIQGLRRVGVEVDVLHVDRAEEGVQAYFRMRRPMEQRIRLFRPNLIHVMYGGVMAERITARAWGVPVVLTFHGSDLLGENISGTLRKVLSRVGILASWAAARRARGVITVSRKLEQTLPRTVDRSKVRILPCGIDLSRFEPMDSLECRRRLGWKEGVFHVLFATSFGKAVKRPELAAAAVAELQRRGVASEMHYMSGIANDEVPIWVNASQVLLLTSLHEGSPTIVKEALACDLPVVSVDVGDVGEQIEGIEGCYLAESSPEDLADKLQQVHRGPPRVQGRHKTDQLSHVRIAQQLQAFYAEWM